MSQISKLMSPRKMHLAALLLLSAFASPAALAALPAKPAAQNASNNPQIKVLETAAAQAVRQGNLPLAIIQLKNALRIDPNNGTIRAQLGLVLLQSGDTGGAERELRQALANGAKNDQALEGLMQTMLISKEDKDLLVQFPEPAAGDKSALAAATLRARAMAFQDTGVLAGAVSSMDRALTISQDPGSLLTRAQIAILQNQVAVASQYIDKALAAQPNNPAALMMKAAVLRVSDRNGAMALLDRILKAHPDYAKARVATIEMQLESNQVDAAQKNINSLLAQSPDMPLANFYNALIMGIQHKAKDGWRVVQSMPPEFIQSDSRIAIGAAELANESGNMESANSILGAYVGTHPASTEPRLRLAALRLKMNNAVGAMDAMAPLMDSKDPRALELIAAVYDKLNQPQNSALYLRKAVAAGSNSGAVRFKLALDDIRGGDTATAAQELVGLVKQTPGNLTGPGVGIDLMIQMGKFADAQKVIDQAEKTNPKNPQPPFFRGQLLTAQSKLDNAAAAFSQALSRDANHVPSLFGRAGVYILQKKYKEATGDLMHAQARQPDSPLSYISLSEVAALTGKPDQAIALLKTAMVKAPKNVDPRIALARYQISLNKNSDALETLKGALQVAPDNGAALALLGNVQQRMGMKVQALDTNKKLSDKYQQSGAAQFLLANSLSASGDKKGAIAALKRAVTLSPDVLQYRQALISVDIDVGDGDGAVAAARDWQTRDKGVGGTAMMAETLMRLKKYPEAQALLEKTQAATPDWRLTMLQSQIATERGDNKQAASILKTWLEGHSTDLPVRQAYAASLMRDGQNPAALQQYEMILKVKNDIPDVLNNAAWLVKDSDLPRALTMSNKAWSLNPNSADIADTYGFLLLKKGDANNALPVLQRAHTINADNGEISYHLAMALSSTGHKADARTLLKATLAKDTKFNGAEDAKKLMGVL